MGLEGGIAGEERMQKDKASHPPQGENIKRPHYILPVAFLLEAFRALIVFLPVSPVSFFTWVAKLQEPLFHFNPGSA